MRLSHSQLESCRADPRRWVREQAAAGPGFARFGYNRALKFAIYRFHRSNDAIDAQRHLEYLMRNFASTERKLQCQNRLNAYIQWANNVSLVVADTRITLDLDLGSGTTLGGEISRLDVEPSGDYRIVLLDTPEPNWRSSLRLPLIQVGISRQFD